MPLLALVLPSLPAVQGRVELSDKSLSGIRAFVQRWPGEVVVVSRPTTMDVSGNLGRNWYDPAELDFAVEVGEPAQIIERLRPDVVQASLHERDASLLRLAPTVVVAENPAIERLRYAWPNAPVAHRPRMIAGALRQERRLQRLLAAADALACNGWAAWNAYRRVGRAHDVAPLLFFDNRLPRNRVEAAHIRVDQRGQKAPGPVRLAFSGRLHVAKGPQLALAASARLAERGVAHTLTFFGAGELEPQLRRDAGPQVSFAGAVPFDPDWMDRVAAEVDLMVLPHTQGDPSGTYVESAGLGVPVVGIANAALRGHAKHGGFALASARRTPDALADAIAGLADAPARRTQLARAGVALMLEQCFEAEFDQRTQQLVDLHKRRRGTTY